jgi:hypothetical protein
MNGAMTIGEVQGVTWLDGRQFSELQFEYWMQYLKGRGFREEEADGVKTKAGKRGLVRTLAIVANGDGQHVTARGDARPTGAGPEAGAPFDDEDRERATFLQRLADSPVEISDAELDFLSDTMARPWGDWSEEQRDAIDELRTRYEGQV